MSWTLAVIFVFYMLFPFFCFLIGNKKRAWSVAVVALVFNWLCTNYFKAGRTNIIYDAIYFIAGGLIFLYRKELTEFAAKYKVIAGVILLIAVVAYFAVGGNTLMMLFFCVSVFAKDTFISESVERKLKGNRMVIDGWNLVLYDARWCNGNRLEYNQWSMVLL